MNTKSIHIHKRFPEKTHVINRLMAEKPSFLALCEDYEICITALKHWAHSTEPDAKLRLEEYETLAQELENEIKQAFPDSSTKTKQE
jgi:hypothetical protein